MPLDTAAVDARISSLIARDRLPGVSVCAIGPEGVCFAWSLIDFGDLAERFAAVNVVYDYEGE